MCVCGGGGGRCGVFLGGCSIIASGTAATFHAEALLFIKFLLSLHLLWGRAFSQTMNAAPKHVLVFIRCGPSDCGSFAMKKFCELLLQRKKKQGMQ